MTIRVAVVLSFLLIACGPPPPPLVAPQWDAIPPGVLDVLCSRLQMDAVASSSSDVPLAIVATTRPLATQQSMSALAVTARGRVNNAGIPAAVADANREIPLLTSGATCSWKPIAAAELARHRDEMVVEISAPAVNPFAREAGMFARVALGGDAPSWYWISLYPSGERWVVGGISVLVQ